MIKKTVFFVCLLAGATAYPQDNPGIDGDEIMSLAEDTRAVKIALKQGDKYYRKGLYDAALLHYMRLYAILKDHSPLNYKIGVSHLYGINPKKALDYFDRSDPGITSDYYCQKGIALVYRHRYAEAKEAFRLYLETLTPRQLKKVEGKINRFIATCDFSEAALRDSVPVFIENLGPNINSFYDDYSAAEVSYPSSRLFFTSRRPKDGEMDITDLSDYKERILYSSEFAGGKASEAQPVSDVGLGKHMSVAGVNPHEATLFYYRSKRRFGDIYRVRFKENGVSTSVRRLRKGISRKPSKETSITFAANGDAYFVTDRLGGEGGTDIWYAEKKGKRRYKRARNMGSVINTPLTEESVYVTDDGLTLYFSSDGRPGMGGFDVYKAQKNDDGLWGEPVNMGYPINSPDDDLFYRLTSDSTIALLSSKRSGGFGGLDIYAVRTDLRIPFELSGSVTDTATGKFLAATVQLFDRANNLPLATAPNDSATGRYLISMEDVGDYYLQAEAPGYRSATAGLTLPTQRHAQLEKNFALERILHPFSLTGHVTNLKTGKPVQAEIILKTAGTDEGRYRAVSDVNTGFYVITLEDKVNVDLTVRATDYFDHSEPLLLKNIAGSESRKDVSLQRSVTTYVLTGVVTDEAHQPVKALIIVTRPTEDQSRQTLEVDENGKYEFTDISAGPFLLEITAEGHFFINSAVDFGDSTLLVRNFALKKIESGAKVVIENILFNTGNATLRPESFTELNKLVNLLKENATVKIEISGHTDNTGSAALNRKLSKNRALSVRNYLLSQGIAVERLEYEGYGFDRPIAPNDTEEGRSVNRRVEIEILD
ncbi:MAG: OmpA family protein [Bacteroidales bacterium]|jgi:outer membrane protein OmpA-like peptidoglycan-associated protein/tetratricopeptide (TPR) repeat protein|nr:OmpA family protein [Bacteroidales bacterium]